MPLLRRLRCRKLPILPDACDKSGGPSVSIVNCNSFVSEQMKAIAQFPL